MIYFTHAGGKWVAGVNNRYKLVLSPIDRPWLFDLRKDPDELINFYNNPEYEPIAKQLRGELIDQMRRYMDPIVKKIDLQ